MEKELRRNQTALVTLGDGIILFSVWSVLRILLILWAGPALDLSAVEAEFGPELMPLARLAVFVILILLMLPDFLLRLYIGRTARKEGMDGRQKNTYLVFAALILLVSLGFSVASLVLAFKNGISDQSYLEFVVSFLVDLTSSVLLAELLVTVRRCRKLHGALEG